MRRFFLAFLAAFTLLSSVPAAAITYGEPDNGRHPYVGLVYFYNSSNTPMWRCSGTLLSPKVFLTAGHCTGGPGEGVASAQVWFSDFEPLGNYPFPTPRIPCTGFTGYPCTGGVRGTPTSHPQYNNFAGFPNTHDVGIVVLERAVRTRTVGVLPQLGFLDTFASKRGQQDITLTPVGYGLKSVRPTEDADRTRFMASQQITSLNSSFTDGFNVRTSNSPGNGTGDGTIEPGGTCFGDSGGPVFYANTNIVVGITSFGLNGNCKGGDYAYRADTADAQTFIRSFLGR